MVEWKLVEQIIKNSINKKWDEAKKEWEKTSLYLADKDNPNTCLCGKFPIRETIVIQNIHTGISVEVGNCCIKKFEVFENFDGIFNALKNNNKINEELINDSWSEGVINEWEKEFLMDVWRKRKLTVKQREKADSIKKKIYKRYNGNRNDK